MSRHHADRTCHFCGATRSTHRILLVPLTGPELHVMACKDESACHARWLAQPRVAPVDDELRRRAS